MRVLLFLLPILSTTKRDFFSRKIASLRRPNDSSPKKEKSHEARDGRTALIQSFIQSRYVNMILEQQFFLRARCRFPFGSSRFKVSDTYLRLLPSVRPFGCGGNPISVRARNGQMTLQERLKEGKERAFWPRQRLH